MKVKFGYDFMCWLQDYNRYNATNYRPTAAPNEIREKFVAYQKTVNRIGYVAAQRQEWPKWYADQVTA